MTTAPPEDQRRLLEVQAFDTRLQQLAHQRKTLPALERIAELEGQIADLSTSLIQSRTAVGDLKREVTKAEGDVEQVRNRAARDQTRLEAGQVGAKDAQAIVGELASLARRQEVLEEVELDAMERLEAHEDALAKLDSANDELVAAKVQVEAERDAQLAELDAEVATVQADRVKAAAGIDAALVTLYDRLRGQLGGLAAAAFRGRRCEGCRLELNQVELGVIRAAGPDQVLRCEECGRILVRLEAPAA